MARVQSGGWARVLLDMRLGIDAIDNPKKHAKHLKAVSEKFDTLRKKELLLSVWEEELDKGVRCHDYVLGLRARVRALRNQYTAMRPMKDEIA